MCDEGLTGTKLKLLQTTGPRLQYEELQNQTTRDDIEDGKSELQMSIKIVSSVSNISTTWSLRGQVIQTNMKTCKNSCNNIVKLKKLNYRNLKKIIWKTIWNEMENNVRKLKIVQTNKNENWKIKKLYKLIKM